jgi:hypothetical protein
MQKVTSHKFEIEEKINVFDGKLNLFWNNLKKIISLWKNVYPDLFERLTVNQTVLQK